MKRGAGLGLGGPASDRGPIPRTHSMLRLFRRRPRTTLDERALVVLPSRTHPFVGTAADVRAHYSPKTTAEWPEVRGHALPLPGRCACVCASYVCVCVVCVCARKRRPHGLGIRSRDKTKEGVNGIVPRVRCVCVLGAGPHSRWMLRAATSAHRVWPCVHSVTSLHQASPPSHATPVAASTSASTFPVPPLSLSVHVHVYARCLVAWCGCGMQRE
jgi:hypothetical protein